MSDGAGFVHSGEIDARILRSRQEMMTVFEQKQQEQTERLENKLDAHKEEMRRDSRFQAEKLDGKISTLTETVDLRLGAQDAKLNTILEAIGGIRTQGDTWHEGDLKDREEVRQRLTAQDKSIEAVAKTAEKAEKAVAKVADDVRDANTKLTFVQWVVSVSKAAVMVKDTSIKAKDAVVAFADKTTKFLLWVIGTTTTILLYWSTVRKDGIIDAIKLWWKLHRH